MPKRFYVAWAFVVLLAAVLPIAIPYFIWPPYDFERGSFTGPDQAEVFGRYAQSRMAATRYLPTSVSVDGGPLLAVPAQGCGPGALHSLERNYTATITLHGAYGIPIGSSKITCEPYYYRGAIGWTAPLVGLAWILGIAVVSAPFVFALRRGDAESAGSRQNDLRPRRQTETPQW